VELKVAASWFELAQCLGEKHHTVEKLHHLEVVYKQMVYKQCITIDSYFSNETNHRKWLWPQALRFSVLERVLHQFFRKRPTFTRFLADTEQTYC